MTEEHHAAHLIRSARRHQPRRAPCMQSRACAERAIFLEPWMTPADEREAERARAESIFIDKLLREITLSPDTLRQIREEAHAGVRDGIRDGVNDVLTPENAKLFWAAGFAALQENAANKAGRFVLSGGGKLLRQAAGIAILIIALHTAFGWQGLVAGWKALTASRSGG